MLRWSDNKPLAIGAYTLAAVLALAEIVILWQAVHPDVPADYRAYYIDRTTTCLPQPVTGEYEMGREIDFRSGGDPTRELRPCGWDGPAGDGMHSIGETARLRFAVSGKQPLTLMVELTGVTLPGPDRQRVIVLADGDEIADWLVTPGITERFEAAIPAAPAESGYLDIALEFPDAINPGKGTSNTHWRSVKLTAASLTPAAVQ